MPTPLKLALALAVCMSTTSCASFLAKAAPGEAPAASSVDLPSPTRVTLANGLTLLVIERHNLPIVSVSAVLRGGEAYSPAGKAGLATLTAELLRKGARGRTAPEIAASIDFIGGSLESGAGLESSTVSLSVLRKDLGTGLSLFSDVLLHPTFPQAELDRLREDYEATLKASLDDGDDVLRRAFSMNVLEGHPYGRHSTMGSLEAISRADVEKFYQAYYRPNNGFVAVVGDITPQEAKSRFEQALGSWKAAPVNAPAIAEPKPATSRHVVFVDMPVNQSFIRLGNVSTKRNTPDYFPLLVMNQILGADFTSRLNQSLRDRQGLAYGAGSGLSMNVNGGTFFAGLNTKAETTAQAIKGLLAEITRIQDEPVSAEELDYAKDYLTGAFPQRFETNADLAAEVVNMEFFGLPKDYLRTYRQHVRAVTAADIQRVARRYLDTDHFTLVVVGHGAAVEKALTPYEPVDTVVRQDLIR